MGTITCCHETDPDDFRLVANRHRGRVSRITRFKKRRLPAEVRVADADMCE
jgi:hypothetical protein